MVTYRYTARDAAGRKVRGVARAADPQALYRRPFIPSCAPPVCF